MEKHTKTKADIKSILEKYNLKPSKQTKTNNQPTNFEIKPNINQSNVVHISKSAPTTPTKSPLIPISPPPILNSIHSGGHSKSLTNSPTPIKQINIQPANTSNTNSSNSIKPLGATHLTPLTVGPSVLDAKSLIDNDKQKELARKQEMPKAVISPGRGSGNKDINIYDFIPTVKTPIPTEKKLEQPRANNTSANRQNNTNPIIMNCRNNLNTNPKQPDFKKPEFKQPEYKKITINPNLSVQASQNYKGDDNSSEQSIKQSQPTKAINLQEIINQTPQNNKSLQKIHSRTPTRSNTPPINTITSNTNNTNNPNNPNNLANQVNLVSNNRNVSIANSNSGGKKSKSVSFGDTPPGELSDLEKQRLLLQKQQMIELEKFKAKKAEIIKLNNRKKEIELMRSIEDEKNKLRKIQEKQHELNNIYDQQLRQQHSSNAQNLTIKNTSNNIKSVIYDVDAKRTKKNIPNPSVIDVPISSSQPQPTPKLQSKLQSKFQEPTNAALVNANKKVLTTKTQIIGGGNNNVKGDVKPIESKSETIQEQNNDKPDNKPAKKKELKIGQPLEYYTKKTKSDIKWPAKSDLYNTETFTETLNTILGAPAFFNKQQRKDKSSIEDIHKALKDVYGFKHINKFKDTLLTTIYKILSYEKIKWLLE